MQIRKSLLAAALAFGLTASAHAGFINGGFETGDFTGWTLEHGMNYGGTINYTSGSAGHAYIIGAGNNDPYSPYDNPFNGNYMARLNEYTPNYDATRISQTGTMLAGETSVFINWAACIEEPGHTNTDEPFFNISIYKNGTLFGSENHTADQGAAGGWTLSSVTGPDGSPLYYSSGQFSLSGLTVGDQVKVVLTVADCALGGHSAYAYLDGIGTVAQPPAGSGGGGGTVPDGGTTLALLTPVLAGMAALRRKFVK